MAEEQDKESKTQEPSQRKLDDARSKGDVAKSADLNQVLSLTAAFAVIMGAGSAMTSNLANALVPFIASPHEMTGLLESGSGAALGRRVMMAAAPLVLSVMAATAAAGVAGNFLQQGLLWTPSKLAPDFKRLSPMSGLQRVFGIDGLVQFFKTLVKLVVTGCVAWMVLQPHARDAENLATMSPALLLPFARSLLVALFGAVLTFLALTAAFDWFWQRQRFMQRMRMSREELKEEHRQSEGDPHVKGRQKQLRIQRAKKRMMAQVPKATLVVTNPTHYAVALRYVSGETPAPICLAKGVDEVALKIREIAAEHEIPIVEDPPLARALYAAVELDDTIPREHYEAVAKVIGFILGRRNRPRARNL